MSRTGGVLFALALVACASAGSGSDSHGGGEGLPDAGGVDTSPPDDGGIDPEDCERMDCATLGAECGTPDDGCGLPLDCGTCGGAESCDGHTCLCTADGAEPNDDSASARSLGSLPDVPGGSASAGDSFGPLRIENAGDADWYAVQATDECCDGNPIIDVAYTAGHEIGAWYVCNAGGLYATCSGSGVAADSTFGSGCVVSGGDGAFTVTTECDGNNEDGTLYLRVRAAAGVLSCTPYTLSVDVH